MIYIHRSELERLCDICMLYHIKYVLTYDLKSYKGLDGLDGLDSIVFASKIRKSCCTYEILYLILYMDL